MEHQSNNIEIDPLWLYYVFVRTFGYKFPALTKHGIRQRTKRNPVRQTGRSRKTRVYKTRKLGIETSLQARAKAGLPHIKKSTPKSNYAYLFADVPKAAVGRPKKESNVVYAERINDYCGVLTMDKLSKIEHQVELCFAN